MMKKRDTRWKFILDKQIGSIPDTGDSVKETRKIRKILSIQRKKMKELWDNKEDEAWENA